MNFITSTTGNLIRLINKSNPTDRDLIVQFVPESLGFSRGMRIEDITIIGRNLPFYQYTSGDREFSVELDFHTQEEDGQDVLNNVRWLESKTMNETFQKGACSILVQMGEVFSDKTWIIKSLSYDLMDFDHLKGLAPRRAKVKLSFCQEETEQGVKRSNFLNSF
jgi:hypothetical protein